MINYEKIIHPSPQDTTQYTHFVLGADIGGTYTTITIGGLHNQKLTQLYSLQFKTQTLDSIIPAIQETLTYSKSEYNLDITDACLGAAGILSSDQTNIQLTNIPLNISIAELKHQTPLQNILLINDFQTIGFGINLVNHSNPHEILNISTENNHLISHAPKAIIGAGTGLGKTIVIYSKEEKIYIPYPSEGGHADFPLYTNDEHKLAHYILNQKQNQQPLTYEDILAGQGIIWIYYHLRSTNKYPVSSYSKQIDASEDKAALISQHRHQDPICEQTFLQLARFYGRCAKNIALDLLPTGGLYIAGGIAIKNQDILFDQEFLQEFYNAYQRTDLLKTIPIYLITDPYISLRGACFAALHYHK